MPPLNERTLVILGKFSQKGATRVVLDNDEAATDRDGAVDPGVFFGKIKPELRSEAGGTYKVDDATFNVYQVDTPLRAAGRPTHELPLLIDSPLLKGAASVGNDFVRIQQRG